MRKCYNSPSNLVARHLEYLFISPPVEIRVDVTFKLHTHLINECKESDSGCISIRHRRVDTKRSDLKNEENIIVITPFAKKQLVWHLNLKLLSKAVECLIRSHLSILMELGLSHCIYNYPG